LLPFGILGALSPVGLEMDRRSFLKLSAAATFAAARCPGDLADSATMPVIDCHIHLFDPTRPGGVPWPDKANSVLYRPALPDRYARLAAPHGVVGAIAVECSPWLIDNFWLCDTVEKNTLMLGYVGNLLPEAPEFGATLDRLHRSDLFLGIRYGNLWNRSLRDAVEKPEFIDGLKLLAQAELVLETANPDPRLIAATLELSDRVPDLRIVLDHLPNAQVPEDAQSRRAYDSDLRSLSQRPHVFVKGSEIPHRISGNLPIDGAAYKAGLDQIWDLFGEDRVMFGSDWPNSDLIADYDSTFSIAKSYVSTQSFSAQEKYFWRNSVAAYRWTARSSAQKQLWTKR
jgi:L-fuconolactonase